jgi:4-hydroxy-tetrahydrodipicolinate reductase
MVQISPTPKGIVIYGTGNVCQTAARIANARNWPIAAVANRSGEKIGKDFGGLSGCETLNGITIVDMAVTNFSALDADIAIIAISDHLGENFSHHRRLLESGLNTICIGSDSSYPAAVDKKTALKLDQIAKANGVTFTGCGLWDTYRLWTIKTLVGPCTALSNLYHRSVTDANKFGLEVIKLARIGEDPASFSNQSTGASEQKDSIYRVFVYQVAISLGLSIDKIDQRQEPVVLDTPVFCTALNREIEAGLCIGMRSVIDLKTKQGISIMAEIDLRLTSPGEGESMSWIVEGDPSVEMHLRGIDTGHATASSAVNRIPDVIAAVPGLVTTDQMSPMRLHL